MVSPDDGTDDGRFGCRKGRRDRGSQMRMQGPVVERRNANESAAGVPWDKVG